MGPTSKDLLHLEQKDNISTLEKSLFMIDKATDNAHKKEKFTSDSSKGTLKTTAVSESGVLGKLKGFLQVIDEANRKLMTDIQEKRQEDYDIEALTGEEEQYIEMDLALGVADLHTPEALAAAKSVLSGQRQISVHADRDDSDSGCDTKVSNDSDYETKDNEDSDSSSETQGSDDSDINCETEADSTGDKRVNNNSSSKKLVRAHKSLVKRSATIRKGQKRPKIEILK